MTGTRERPATTVTFSLLNALFMAAGASMAALSLYPAYSSTEYILVAVAAIAAAVVIALVCYRLALGGLVALGLSAAAFVAIGLTMAIPGVMSGDVAVGAALRELVLGPVTGWKDIVTLPLPLGAYGATLVPVLALLLGGTLAALWLALTARRRWGLAAGVTVAMVGIAIVVGPATRAEPLTWAPYGMYVNREFIVGLATFALLLGWLAWRADYARSRALARTADDARLATPPRLRVLSTGIAATVMAVVAVGSAAIFAGPVAAETPRDVARSVIDPRLIVDSTVTPLAAYRSYFSDEAFDEVLFTVTVTGGEVSRVRLAVLPYFTGDAFTAAAPPGTAPSRFERVPSGIAAQEGAIPVSADIEIGAHTGIWLPLVGQLGSVTFTGVRSSALVDSFFYQPDTASGLVTVDGGVREGDHFSVAGFVPERTLTLNSLGAAPGGDLIDSNVIPPALTDWVVRQGVTHDGAGLAELVALLRERGYLSHGLSQSRVTPQWETALGAYTFAASPAGHSYDRIDRMFAELTARESESAATPGASLVAAVGDDEQFASAVALMAAELGFPSRVVLGARLADTDDSGWTVPACVDGECRGQNMAVWAEVQASNGAWVPVDVTPQHSTPPSPEVTQQQDPKFASALDPARAQPIAPPASQRGAASAVTPPMVEEPAAWGWLTPLLGAVGVGVLAVLIVVVPMIAIIVWKALRRRRRKHAEPRDAIHHGWDEYVDNALDSGLAPLPLATRLEAAATYGTSNGAQLARMTDAATFGTDVAIEDDAARFWELVEADRKEWLATRSRWARLRMRLSLRSVWHSVTVQAPVAVPESTTGPGDSSPGARG